ERGIFRSHERTGRPLGDAGFLKRIEESVCRVLQRQKPGPKQKNIDIRYAVPPNTPPNMSVSR
ncbi:MAG: hypothetical protein WA121_02310, partial [Syntrophales bacterium]